jgi:hypothetical protein
VDLSDVDGFARMVANELHFVRADWASIFEAADTSAYIYRVRDPGRMVFTVERYDEERDERVREGVYEVSVRRLS